MNEKQQFLSLLKVPRKKLLLKHFCRYGYQGLTLAGILILVFALVARYVVIVHLLEKSILITSSILVITALIAFFRKPSIENAANLFDTYVLEDRVKTALMYLEDEAVMIRLQRRDTLLHMKRLLPKLDESRIKLFYEKKAIVILLLFALAIVSFLVPNETMETAKQLEVDKNITKETKREIEKLSAIDEKEPELFKELMEQTNDIKKSEELLKKLLEKEASLAKEKQIAMEDEQKLKDLSKQISEFKEISKSLNQADSEKLKKALEQLNEKLPTLTEEQQTALENLIAEATGKKVDSLAELSEEQLLELLASLEDELDKMMDNVQSLNQLALSQQQIQQLATTLNQNMTNAGLQNSKQLTFASKNPSSQNSANGQQTGNGQSQAGQSQNPNGQGTNNGSGAGSGSGQGSGNGSGTGSGSGQGSGSGSGTGSGSGSGSGNGSGGLGAGFGQGSRELTIPEKIFGNETVENDFGQTGEGTGEQQIAPEAPVLKGNVRPYEEVYGQYENSYRESLERMDLPNYLEDVVKDYFSELNPEGE